MLLGSPDRDTFALMADDDSLERAVAGALRSAIAAHGPITAANMTSAVKRVVGNLRNAKLGGLAAVMGRRRWAGVDAESRVEVTAAGGRAAWAGLSTAERSAEMRKRAAKRKPRPPRA